MYCSLVQPHFDYCSEIWGCYKNTLSIKLQKLQIACLLSVINVDPSANLVDQFMTWSRENNMSCNPKKCKELIFRSKLKATIQIDIPQCSSLVLLRVTIQSDCKFRTHVNLK